MIINNAAFIFGISTNKQSVSIKLATIECFLAQTALARLVLIQSWIGKLPSKKNSNCNQTVFFFKKCDLFLLIKKQYN